MDIGGQAVDVIVRQSEMHPDNVPSRVCLSRLLALVPRPCSTRPGRRREILSRTARPFCNRIWDSSLTVAPNPDSDAFLCASRISMEPIPFLWNVGSTDNGATANTVCALSPDITSAFESMMCPAICPSAVSATKESSAIYASDCLSLSTRRCSV